jgi:hypothetical protein
LSLPGVILVTWRILAVIRWCFDAQQQRGEKCHPYATRPYKTALTLHSRTFTAAEFLEWAMRQPEVGGCTAVDSP